jgi:hypothetical protein
VITGIFSRKTGFLENSVRDDFVANLMGYKSVPYGISEKPRFSRRNPNFPESVQTGSKNKNKEKDHPFPVNPIKKQ